AILLARLAQPFGKRARQLRRQRALADAGRISLGHTEHAADGTRWNTETSTDAADRRVRRGDERIGAVIDIKQGRLRTLEHHRLAAPDQIVEEQGAVAHPRT